jgi:hypothetical protein
MDLPGHFGSWKGAHNRLRSGQPTAPGRRFTALPAQADAEGDLEWVVSVDSTIVRRSPARRSPTATEHEC